jgi:hypothetical protein
MAFRSDWIASSSLSSSRGDIGGVAGSSSCERAGVEAELWDIFMSFLASNGTVSEIFDDELLVVEILGE